jgi:uncharacterized membrane protein
MKELLITVNDGVVLIIHGMALVIIAAGTIQAFLRGVRAIIGLSATGDPFHSSFTQYVRWLVSGLTFLIAADILALGIDPTWDKIGQLGAISVIRAMLNFFLERDLASAESREDGRQQAGAKAP